jgi:DNA-binding GntR family transcriptional regulator
LGGVKLTRRLETGAIAFLFRNSVYLVAHAKITTPPRAARRRDAMKPRLTSLQAKVVRAGGLRALKPGDALPSERVLAEASGVGRAPVRGMFAAMQRDGVVERTARGWILRKRIPELPPAEEGSKRQRAKDFLLAELGSGRLRPGDQLSELALAKQIGVSTVSVREALLEMSPLGLLTKRERQRWEVALFSEERIREMREFREMVELHCLRMLLAKGLDAQASLELKKIQSETNDLVSQQRPRAGNMLAVDLNFHRFLLEASGNSLITERAEFIYLIIGFQLVSPFFSPDRGLLGLRQHLKIMNAILRDDLPTAERSLLAHLQSAEESFHAIVQRSSRSER